MTAYNVEYLDNEIIIQQHFEPLTRVLGLPFLAGGLYWFHFIPVAIYKYVVVGQFLGLVRNLPGLAFGTVLAIAFASPGIFLTLMGKRVIVDRTAKQVVRVLDFVVWKWRRRSPLAMFKTIALRYETVRSDRSKSRQTVSHFYTVVLLSEGDTTVLLAIVDDPEDGARLGKQMSTLLGLPFVDQTRAAA